MPWPSTLRLWRIFPDRFWCDTVRHRLAIHPLRLFTLSHSAFHPKYISMNTSMHNPACSLQFHPASVHAHFNSFLYLETKSRIPPFQFPSNPISHFNRFPISIVEFGHPMVRIQRHFSHCISFLFSIHSPEILVATKTLSLLK
jgi:hypothetical protein